MKHGILFAKIDPAFLSNRKIVQAGRDGRDVFLHALCQNAGRGGQGWIPLSDLEPWYVARQLGITEHEASNGVDLAVAAKLIAIENDRVELIGWDTEWARRPQTDAERQAGRRSRKGKPTDNHVVDSGGHGEIVTRHDSNVTIGQVPDRHESHGDIVTVTGVSRPVTTNVTVTHARAPALSLSLRSDQRERESRSKRDSHEVVVTYPDGDWVPDHSSATEAAEAAAVKRGADLAFELQAFRDRPANLRNAHPDPNSAWRFWLRNARASASQARPIKLATPADEDDDMPPLPSDFGAVP